MRTFHILPVLLLAACASVDDRASCSVSTDCPRGQYCARTPDGSVCWPDAVPPTVSGVTVSCEAPTAGGACLRDGTLRVAATVADDTEVLGADVTLDLGGPAVPMQRGAGGQWTAILSLADFPFEAFEADVVASIVTRDGARNESSQGSSAVHVTRLRWAYDVGSPITAPAVLHDGSAVFGVSRNSAQVVAVRPDGTKKWEATVASRFVTMAPIIGDRAIWVADDRSVYAIDPSSFSTIISVGVTLDGTTTGPVAAVVEPSKEWALVGSSSGRLGAASSAGSEYARSGLGDACTTGPVVGVDGRIYVATATVTSAANLRSFVFDGAFTAKWSATIGVNVTAPLAIDANGAIWAGSQDARLTRTVPSDAAGDPIIVATLSGSAVDSPVILASGDVVIGDQSGTLNRFANGGTRVWSNPPTLDGPALAPMVLTATRSILVVSTKAGSIYAISDDGSIVWSGNLDGAELRAGNIHTATSAGVSTAYFSSASGKLYAVIVDGRLDASAPWPKAFHDARNTNRAGAPQ